MSPANIQRGKVAVHYGAGNIGRGFIGPLLVQSGYHVAFADIQAPIIDALNEIGEFDVHVLGHKTHTEKITNVSGVMANKPELVDTLVEAELITTSVGAGALRHVAPTIAEGIKKRRAAGSGYLNVIACENMVGATSKLQSEVEKSLADHPDDLAYMKEKVGFANCSVDRIVPPFEGAKKLDVGVEEFFEWIVDKTAIKGNQLEVKGMKLSDDLNAYIERKLFTLNTGHATLAFIGLLKGYETIQQSAYDNDVREVAQGAMRESGAALIKKHNFDPKEHEEYIQKTLSRFANPNIKDLVLRVSRNPLRKLGKNDRLVGPANMAKGYGLPHGNLLKAVAAALLHKDAEDEESTKLAEIIKDKGLAKAIVEVTEFEEGSEEVKTVLKEYEEHCKIQA